MALDKNLSARV
jgi:uncharacterized protein